MAPTPVFWVLEILPATPYAEDEYMATAPEFELSDLYGLPVLGMACSREAALQNLERILRDHLTGGLATRAHTFVSLQHYKRYDTEHDRDCDVVDWGIAHWDL